MSILQLPPAASAPPGPDSPPGGGSGAPPGPPFASVLEHQQARTATAEGHPKQDQDQQPVKQPSGDDSAPVAGSTLDPVTPGTKDEPVTVADASALAALLGGVAQAKPAAISTAAATAVSTAGDGTAAAATITPATGSPAGAVASAATAALSTTPATAPALAASTTSVGADAAPAAPGTTQDSPTEVVAQPTVGPGATPQFAAPRPSASATPVPSGTPEASLPTSPQNDAANLVADVDHGPAAATAPAPGVPVATSPVAAPQVTAPPSATLAAAPAPPAGVGLEHAIETVRLALRAAADRGVSHARIELHPRELGGVEIHLRQTADGLVARVVAEHATAAQLLQHAGAELRRSLETQGLTLLRLDIGASGEQDRRAPGEQRGFGDAAGGAGNGGAEDPTSVEDVTTTPTDPTTTTLTLANGALVDVLA
jgi:flagellar hook-length control protein FliK